MESVKIKFSNGKEKFIKAIIKKRIQLKPQGNHVSRGIFLSDNQKKKPVFNLYNYIKSKK